MRYDLSGRVGVPLPPFVAYGGGVVDAIQQLAFEAGGTGRAAGYSVAMREVMMILYLSGGHHSFGTRVDSRAIQNSYLQWSIVGLASRAYSPFRY
jgi:hypothetical protein